MNNNLKTIINNFFLNYDNYNFYLDHYWYTIIDVVGCRSNLFKEGGEVLGGEFVEDAPDALEQLLSLLLLFSNFYYQNFNLSP